MEKIGKIVVALVIGTLLILAVSIFLIGGVCAVELGGGFGISSLTVCDDCEVDNSTNINNDTILPSNYNSNTNNDDDDDEDEEDNDVNVIKQDGKSNLIFTDSAEGNVDEMIILNINHNTSNAISDDKMRAILYIGVANIIILLTIFLMILLKLYSE